MSIYFADVVYAAHARMRYLPRSADLIVKAGECPWIIANSFGQELERHRLIKLKIGGAIDFAHAATADQTDDAISRGQQSARHEAPVVSGRRGTARSVGDLKLRRYQRCRRTGSEGRSTGAAIPVRFRIVVRASAAGERHESL